MAEDRGKPPARPGDIHVHQEHVDGGASGVVIHQSFHVTAGVTASTEAGYRCMAQPPEVFVPRHQLGALIALLCQAATQQTEGASVGITTALRGAGGFGKTTLAQQLCFELEVRCAYPDGILWVTMGEHVSEAVRLGRVLDLIRWWSNEEPPAFSDAGPAGAELRRRLAGKRVLVVVDDVWQSPDLMPFQGLEAGAAVLVTTRDRRMLPRGCQEIEVDAMEQGESVALLAAGLPEGHAHALRALGARLGRWPLLLELVNRHLSELVHHDHLAVTAAVTEVHQLLDHEGLTAFDLGDDDARRTAVERTMAVSLRRLEDAERQRYEILAVFPEDIEIPLSVLARYWSLPENAARNLCERLNGLSLLERFDRGARTVRLHDVFRQYLLDRQRDAMPALHRQWLDAFCPTNGDWPNLQEDEYYAWRHLPHHLHGAGKADALYALLGNYNWLDAKLRAVGAVELLVDFDWLTSSSAEKFKELCLVRDALRLSSHVLAEDAEQLPSQLIGRLGYFEEQSKTTSLGVIAHLLDQARDERRFSWLCPIQASLTPPGGPLERMLVGHDPTAIISVAVTSDDKHVISASMGGTLKIWNLDSGAETSPLKGCAGAFWAMAVSPDNQLAVLASNDGTLQVWNLITGEEERTLGDHVGAVFTVAVTPDGQHAISGGEDGKLKLWSLATGEVRALGGHADAIYIVTVTPDGQHAISGGKDGMLRLWSLATGKERTLAGC